MTAFEFLSLGMSGAIYAQVTRDRHLATAIVTMIAAAACLLIGVYKVFQP